jgi:hypothetical protein
MKWRLAHSLEQLRNQVNVLYPSRSKDSDGSIGDASHASRSSDHNPWITDGTGINVVSAIDITHDPKSGCDSYRMAEQLRLGRDARIKYIISNRRICAGSEGPQPWTWRPYTGINPHDHHVHISVKSDKAHYDDTSPWQLARLAEAPAAITPQTKVVTLPTLRKGSKGDDVAKLQRFLVGKSLEIKVDGDFGDVTRIAVIQLQKAAGLVADGVVGPQTWKALGAS